MVFTYKHRSLIMYNELQIYRIFTRYLLQINIYYRFTSNRSGIRGWFTSNRSGVRGWFTSNRSGIRGWFTSNRSGIRGWFTSNRSGRGWLNFEVQLYVQVSLHKLGLLC